MSEQIDVYEVLDGWESGKYKAGHVMDQLRKINGNGGSFSERIRDALNSRPPPTQEPESEKSWVVRPDGGIVRPNGQKPNTKQSTTTKLSPEEVKDILRRGDDLLKDTITDKIPTSALAEHMLKQGWEGDDPFNRYRKFEPHNIKDILNERMFLGEYFSELSPNISSPLKGIIFNAWRAWIIQQNK